MGHFEKGGKILASLALACLCGAGDAFAAGVAMYRATGRSLLPGLAAPSAEGAAVAGCALAIRWLDRVAPLTRSDFHVSFAGRRGRLAA